MSQLQSIFKISHFKSLINSSAFRDTSVLTVGTAVSQCIFFAGLPLLTKVYGPEEFGQFAVILAVINILSVLFSLKYEVEILSPEKDSNASDIMLLCLFLILISSITITGLALIFPWNLLEISGVSSLIDFVKFVGIFAGLTSLFGISQWWLNRFKRYFTMAALRILQSASFVALALYFSNYSLSSNILVWSQVASVSICAFISFFLVRDAASHWKIKNILKTARNYINTPKFVWPSAMMDVVSQQLPLFLVAFLFSIEMSGQYSFAWRITFIPMTIIGRAIAQIFWKKLSLIKNDHIQAGNLLIKTWLILFIIGFPMLSILLIGEEVFTFFLGDEWLLAGEIAEVIVPIAFLAFITSPTSATFILFKKQNYVFLQGLCVLVCRPLAVFIGYIYSDFKFGLQLLVIFEAIYIIMYMLIAYRLTALNKTSLFSGK